MVETKSDYTIEELASKIETTKAELKAVKNLLAWYEEELECKKLAVPLGVPISRISNGLFCVSGVNTVLAVKENYSVTAVLFDVLNLFHSKESAEKHAEMLLDWRKDGLVANASGNPIDIKVLLPLLKRGWVAMDKNGSWFWYASKPTRDLTVWVAEKAAAYLSAFNLKPAEDWETSLRKCGI